MKLLPQEHDEIFQYVHSICGVTLDESKAYLVEGRLGGLAEELGCTSFRQLVGECKSDSSRALERRVISSVTTGETVFFRDAAPFDLLRHKLLPEWIDRHGRAGKPLRIWSAACSTGQEVYSIAIVLKEVFLDPNRYEVRLLGTDISDQAIARASRGIYSSIEVERGLPAELKARYFLPVMGGWQIRDEIRAMASFRNLNLMRDFSGLGRFDFLFCRNVAIYFKERDRISLFERIERALEPSGCLIIGAMESLSGISPRLEPKRYLRSVYYEFKEAGARLSR